MDVVQSVKGLTIEEVLSWRSGVRMVGLKQDLISGSEVDLNSRPDMHCRVVVRGNRDLKGRRDWAVVNPVRMRRIVVRMCQLSIGKKVGF